MLIEIQCDKFAPEHQIIRFNSGLNTVLGSAGGSNAIGKSTFLWIIDYVFGGESYYSLTDDIKKESHCFGKRVQTVWNDTLDTGQRRYSGGSYGS